MLFKCTLSIKVLLKIIYIDGELLDEDYQNTNVWLNQIYCAFLCQYKPQIMQKLTCKKDQDIMFLLKMKSGLPN